MGTFVQKSRMNLAGQVAALILGTLASVVIARVLGPEGKGIFAICTLIPFLIVTVCDLGVVSASAYFLARRRHSPPEVFGNNIVFAGAVGAAGVLAGALAVSLFRANFFASVPLGDLYFCLLLAPLNLLFLFVQSVFLGLQKFAEYNLASVRRYAFFLIGTVVTVWALRWGVEGAIAAGVFSYVLADLYLLAETKRLAGRPVFRVSLPYLRDVARFGLQSHVGNLLSYLNYRGDMLLVNWFLGPSAVGFYSIGVLLVEQLWLFTNAAKLVIFLQVAAEEDPQRRNEFTPRVARVMLLTTLPAAVVLGLAGGFIVELLFSSRYLPAVRPLRLLIPGAAAMGISRLLANDIAGRGRPLLNSYISAGMLALNLALNCFWIPRFGIAGAALASTVSYSATFLARLALYCRLSGNSWKDLLLPRAGDLALIREGIRKFLSRAAPIGTEEKIP